MDDLAFVLQYISVKISRLAHMCVQLIMHLLRKVKDISLPVICNSQYTATNVQRCIDFHAGLLIIGHFLLDAWQWAIFQLNL